MRRAWIQQFILGAHALSVMFHINTKEKLDLLTEAMRKAAKLGAKIFEIPYGLVGGEVTWQMIAQAAKEAGIEEIALCHFWGYDDNGRSLCGDPLGDDVDVARAFETMHDIVAAAEILREKVVVRFIDGPTWGGLGQDYSHLTITDRHNRMVKFFRVAAQILKRAKLILAVEFLRPKEDKVVGGTRAMIKILKAVNRANVRMHFDVFHSIEQGEDPAKMIRLAADWIVYLHLHGDKRIAPGAKGDHQDWDKIVATCKKILSRIKNMPVIPEPFGDDTVADCSALGDGVARMGPFVPYLEQAYTEFEEAGLPLAA
ncbi:MAG: TIM barrel protein [Patescibacteria group bacterium]